MEGSLSGLETDVRSDDPPTAVHGEAVEPAFFAIWHLEFGCWVIAMIAVVAGAFAYVAMPGTDLPHEGPSANRVTLLAPWMMFLVVGLSAALQAQVRRYGAIGMWLCRHNRMLNDRIQKLTAELAAARQERAAAGVASPAVRPPTALRTESNTRAAAVG